MARNISALEKAKRRTKQHKNKSSHDQVRSTMVLEKLALPTLLGDGGGKPGLFCLSKRFIAQTLSPVPFISIKFT